ncbi:FAD/NAD(P)-binding domain-containing protein [Daedaleopsis nitida]|nr:FAD/NAD(P)-binding domain-containing protein [Daedaleopsis nitida]
MTTVLPGIAIIGGGPAGLTLLLTLHRRGIPATVYERESGFSSRAHLGGTLDLGWDSGQRALRENGLEDEFKKFSRPEGDEFKMCDGAGNVLLAKRAEENADKDPRDLRPEIDRSKLRKILLDAVPADAVKWGHGLSSIRSLGGGKHELTFTNGTTVVSDLVVGAEGGHSRVRPLVSPATPIYHGVTGSEISISPDVAARPDMKDIVKLVGDGSLYMSEGGKIMAFQRNGDGRIRAYAWFCGPEEWKTPSEPGEARAALVEQFKGWAPWTRKFIESCDDAAIYHRPLYYLPVGHRWEHVAGVTLIGDAAHLVSPFGGAGANIAMLDGLELGLVLAGCIVGGGEAEEREAAVAAWEEKMFVSAGKAAAVCMENITTFTSSAQTPDQAVEKAKEFILNPAARREA